MSEQQPREIFTVEIDSRLLSELKNLAEREDRPLHSLLEEAMTNLLRQRASHIRPDVQAAYRLSIQQFGPVYEKLKG
ncbi:MAG: hypothetical protein ACXU8U_03525 [Asticcacaulis sp.]